MLEEIKQERHVLETMIGEFCKTVCAATRCHARSSSRPRLARIVNRAVEEKCNVRDICAKNLQGF